MFHHKLDSSINITNFDGSNSDQLEIATNEWINVVKSAMDLAIPKSSYKFICQLKTTAEIKNLELQFKNLYRHASRYGWTIQRYREYIRIKT